MAEGQDVAWQYGRCSLCLNLLIKYDLSDINLKVAVLPGKNYFVLCLKLLYFKDLSSKIHNPFSQP